MSALEDVVMKEGDVLVVPRGMRHRPAVEEGKEASAMVIEVAGVVNTGDAEGESAEKMRNPIVDARGQA